MAEWMLYVTAFGALVSGLALIAEVGTRQSGCPTRFVWLVAMILSMAPVALLATAILASGPAAGTAGAAGSGPEAMLNRLLLLAWATSSIVFMAGLRVSAWTLRRGTMSWRTVMIAGDAVLVSTDIGPAVVGARHPRFVIPGRVLAWEEKLQQLVMAHEREHVRAGDHRILPLALGLVALAPWCLPLWWQLHRLREAFESDCDARVVAATGAARDYAGVVLALSGRCRRAPVLMPALAPGVRAVERRIRRIVGGVGASPPRPGRRVLITAGFLLAVSVAAFAPRPDQPYFGLERALLPPATAESIVQEPPSAFVILRFLRPATEPEGESP